jgi:hypothetical protein
MRPKTFLRLCTAAAILGLGPTLHGASPAMLKLLKVLKDRGSISQQEYDDLVLATEAEAEAAKTAQLPQPQVQPATAQPQAFVADTAVTPSKTTTTTAAEPAADKASKATADASTKHSPKWYDRIGLRGYTQIRYHSILDQEGADLNVPNDRSISKDTTFFIRRARLILSGDVSEHLFIYAQPDLNGAPTSGDFSVQLRDMYGDVSFDKEKEFRIRLGQSKVPFGWVNMQSSSNRGPLERPDAINSAVEGERDIGGFFYWAPDEIRKRYAELVRSGLKGSGDYGVFGIGAYSGQGLNRLDLNGQPHYIVKASYPFKLPSGQFFETGVHAYTGRFVTSSQAITSGGTTLTPTAPAGGVADERVGFTAVWYPQPFGVEAEWNFGVGPELSANRSTIQSQFLHGGYVQLSYKEDNKLGNWFPFLRWNYYDGGRKFAVNAPSDRVNEVDFGLEWAPWQAVEFTVQYTHTFERTNTRTSPYAETSNADRISFQAQLNY